MTQNEYLEILFNEVGIDTVTKRNDFISIRLDRKIRFLDDLTTKEKSRFIDELKDMKSSQQPRNYKDEDDYR